MRIRAFLGYGESVTKPIASIVAAFAFELIYTEMLAHFKALPHE